MYVYIYTYKIWALSGLLIVQKHSGVLESNSVDTDKLMFSGANHTSISFVKK